MINKNNERGFTLIELLVVIGIIGILSGIVLVNVNSARNKAKDAAIKGSIEQIRMTAEIFYEETSNVYTGLAADADYLRIDAKITDNDGALTENIGAQAYCAYSTLNDATGVWCTDSLGNAGYYAAAPATCAGAAYTCQ